MKYVILMLSVLFLAACGTPVEVPPATVGKKLTQNGYAPETIPPSKFRLDACMTYCDRLVLLQANDSALMEQLVVFMPTDKLNLSIEIRGTFSIPADKKTVDSIYDRVTAEPIDSSVSIIKATTVYTVYGQQAVRGIVRSEITKYTIAQVLEQREAIGANIHAAISKKLKETSTPLFVSRFELANIQPPEVIVNAQQAAKEREIDIQKAEADAQVDLVVAEKDLEIAKKNRLVEREKAEAMAEQNKIAANSITPQLLAYKQLETAIEIVKLASANSNTVFLPMPMNANDVGTLTDGAVLAKMLGKELGK